MEQKSLYRDLLRNPRSSEDSRIAVASWGTPVDGYAPELPVASSENEKSCDDYYALSAERLLYRGMVLGLPVDSAFAASEAMQSARPFGQGLTSRCSTPRPFRLRWPLCRLRPKMAAASPSSYVFTARRGLRHPSRRHSQKEPTCLLLPVIHGS